MMRDEAVNWIGEIADAYGRFLQGHPGGMPEGSEAVDAALSRAIEWLHARRDYVAEITIGGLSVEHAARIMTACDDAWPGCTMTTSEDGQCMFIHPAP